MGDIPEPETAAMAVPEPSSCLTLRVFYLRVSRCEVDESMLDTLTLTHIPLTPDTNLEVSGADADQKPSISSGKGSTVSCSLRRGRVDARSEEATFVSTATVRMSGSVRFEVHHRDERLLVGILEMCDAEGEGKKSWVMKCQVATQRGTGFLRCGRDTETKPPAVEVYVAGVFRGTPIVFTKAMQLRFRRRRQVKAFMDPIPECGEQAEDMSPTPPKHEPQESEYRCYKPEPDADDEESSLYMKSAGLDEDEEYSELSWFTAGVRVGVGISLGICLGVGIGAGLLLRSYQSTSRTLKRRLISNLLR
ncbi:uncharacterized protein At1g01500-like [Panicum virgatum]|uniref:Erythronate-4-phosphate dehydrogenase family protein n=1 Tax=Panicum virgatum TaxID=38727 RepID=A0A8T0MZH4_PANVG|nr:uncharacterized protein At1g01500-like [Panicum virgatum]XP_039825619.1 uncharacterized protein At1g01500-like [Panicum virgatum]XP_039825620.1 uncharacterized protein At1g01500-like [Panicum virgatum]KAG2542312.1 hypothetical protein PVAP13_9NG839678 [Panicum virgatum]KAG2542313.1 hypothetical protein PVAP13_9NG839678 [Panicum virgatum]KAG2542315.1 hypothetical protein PVAP13_9NG839678 [Panicum virgatum]KAG2542316.1 hypothetical protein PVAP13_9NG839678 [Panicum virgatum]